MNQAIDEAIMVAIRISFKKSIDNRDTIVPVLAPKTLRIPISFTRCSALKAAGPNKPRHDISIAIPVK